MERRGGITRWARIGFVIAAMLFAIGIVVQVFLAGMSVFDPPGRWADHVSIGQQIGTLPILLVIFAIAGRLSKLTIGMSVAIFFLYGLQFAFANADAGAVAAFHAVNALALFWLTVQVAQQARPLAFPTRQA